MKVIKNGTVFCADGVLRPLDIAVENGKIAALAPSLTGDETLDAAGCIVTPGLIDLHTHGAVGEDASDGSEPGLRAIARHHAANGVTGFLATTMTIGADALVAALENAADTAESRRADEARILGVNLEGPFFDMGKRGAQNPAHIRNPDLALFRRLWDAARGTLRLVDVAPELPGALPFIAEVSQLCRVSVAHTNANYDEALAGFSAGASHVTHLFNAMPPLHHRDPGVIGAASDRAAFAEVISDGVHLHPATVRAAFRLFGRERVCLISDSIRACGMTPGTYDLGGLSFTVRDGRATFADGTLVGSITPLSECLRRAVSFGVPLEDALTAATANPARAAGVSDTYGTVEPGKAADLVVWSADLQPKRIFIGGAALA